jgi:hypothetical protein
MPEIQVEMSPSVVPVCLCLPCAESNHSPYNTGVASWHHSTPESVALEQGNQNAQVQAKAY